MTDEKPIELLEAERRIKSEQVGDLGITKIGGETMEEALTRLRTVLASKPVVANSEADRLEREASISKLRSTWNAPKRHVSRTEFDLRATEWMAANGKLASKLGSGFTAALVGTRGPGKTQMAVELMREVTRRLKPAYYCTAMDYFMRIKDAFHQDREERQRDAQVFFVKPALLVIDEVNVRSDSAWEDNMLADLIGKRYNGVLDTLLISNQTVPEFEQSIGASILDRLNETGGIIECNWKSFRE